MAPQLPPDHAARMERARLSLDGLSVGDAFGQHFMIRNAEVLVGTRTIPFPRWRYTDDTEMALAIVETLGAHGRADPDALACRFVRRYERDPSRGYGATARQILQQVAQGTAWQDASRLAFGGEGSMGNGAAMRVAPLGAYFADDLDRVVAEARQSAEVTHNHPEAKAGAIAIAVAAAYAWRLSAGLEQPVGGELIETAIRYTPPGETRAGLEKALALDSDALVTEAAHLLGCGISVTAQDTVPFTLWCAARHLDDYREAIWTTVTGGGDCDTTCAIVGGIVALAAGRESIPGEWLTAREPLDWEE
jgi:ADP-ribosylglycohydrolase